MREKLNKLKQNKIVRIIYKVVSILSIIFTIIMIILLTVGSCSYNKDYNDNKIINKATTPIYHIVQQDSDDDKSYWVDISYFTSEDFYDNLYAYLLKYQNSGNRWAYDNTTPQTWNEIFYYSTGWNFYFSNLNVSGVITSNYIHLPIDSITVTRNHQNGQSQSCNYDVWNYAIYFYMYGSPTVEGNVIRELQCTFSVYNNFINRTTGDTIVMVQGKDYLVRPINIMAHNTNGQPLSTYSWSQLYVKINPINFTGNKEHFLHVLTGQFIDKQDYNVAWNNGFNQGYDQGFDVGYDVGFDNGLISHDEYNIFSAIRTGFDSVATLLNIQLLPNITIGLLLFTPLVVVIIIAIVKMIKG